MYMFTRAKLHKLCFCVMGALMLCVMAVLFADRTEASANMAEPHNQEGSGVVFDKHESVKVENEVLNIRFTAKDRADIEAVYTLKNITAQSVHVLAMFLSPAYGQSSESYHITANGAPLSFTRQSFSDAYGGSTQRNWGNWEEVLAQGEKNSDEHNADHSNKTVIEAVIYSFDFEPLETVEVAVRYTYNIIVEPYYTYVSRLNYLLTPAKYWQDFGFLEINLTLHESRPYLTRATLPFTKLARRTYQFTSDTLPSTDLRITVSSLTGIMGGPIFWILIGVGTAVGLGLILFYVLTYLKRKKTASVPLPRDLKIMWHICILLGAVLVGVILISIFATIFLLYGFYIMFVLLPIMCFLGMVEGALIWRTVKGYRKLKV